MLIITERSDDVPVPEPAKTSIMVGTYIFPGWYRDIGKSDDGTNNADTQSEWRMIAKYTHPRPLLGFYDDSLPQVNDWHIKWALEAGISWFAFDWYANPMPDGTLERRLARTLDQGFLNARYNQLMKFCIHWCNHGLDWTGPLDFSPAAFKKVMEYCAEKYFSLPNYLRVDGRPVFMVWDVRALIDAAGGEEIFAKQVIPEINMICERRGLKAPFLIWVDNDPKRIRELDFGDAITGYSYSYMTTKSRFKKPGSAPYIEQIEAMPRVWRYMLNGPKTFMISSQSGWDDTPRAYPDAWVRTENTPELFERSLREGRDLVRESFPYFLIEAWNEWGEGSMIEPSVEEGFARLEAIRRVFSTQYTTHQWVTHQWVAPTQRMIDEYSVLKGEELERARDLNSLINAEAPMSYEEQVEVICDPTNLPAPIIELFTFNQQAEESDLAASAMKVTHVNEFNGGEALNRRIELSGTLIPEKEAKDSFKITGEDPFMMIHGEWGDFSAIRAIAIKVRFVVPEGISPDDYTSDVAELFWETDRVPLGQGFAKRYIWEMDGQPHTYLLSLDKIQPKEGTLIGIRIDATDIPGAQVQIDWVGVLGDLSKPTALP